MSRETRRALIAAAAAVGLTMTPAEAARLVEPTGYSELRQLVEAHPDIDQAIIPGLGVAPLLMGKKAGLRVEDVFNTSLWAGNGSARTITTGIDSGEGSLVWIKSRTDSNTHTLFDTNRGATNYLFTSSTAGQQTVVQTLSAFTSSGFNLGTSTNVNGSSRDYVGWQFRRAPKFFDTVAYTGNGATSRQISHNLGIKPGLILIKRINAVGDWIVYHCSPGANQYGVLNVSAAFSSSSSAIFFNNTEPDAVEFTVGSGNPVNQSGGQYIAYLFAHDPAADGLIQCGSCVGNGSTTGPIVNLGWRPQYLILKDASITGNWPMFDGIRGLPSSGNTPVLYPNLSNSEYAGARYISATDTGFQLVNNTGDVNNSGSTYIYMAIREAA